MRGLCVGLAELLLNRCHVALHFASEVRTFAVSRAVTTQYCTVHDGCGIPQLSTAYSQRHDSFNCSRNIDSIPQPVAFYGTVPQ